MSATAQPSQLSDLVRAIAVVRTAGIDAEVVHEAAPALYESAFRAREAGFTDEVDELLGKARDDTQAAPARRAITMAGLQENDREFRVALTDGLEVQRVELVDFEAEVADLDLKLVSTPAGALLPRSTRSGERELLTIGTEIQLLTNNDLPEDRAVELHQRGFDVQHLNGQLQLLYTLRSCRRLAWGMGMVALTDQRAFGVVFDHEVPRVSDSVERDAMPLAIMEGDGWASLIVFSARRDLFDSHEIVSSMLNRSRPYVNLIGDCSLALDTYQVVGSGNLIVKPGKTQIADAVAAFMR